MIVIASAAKQSGADGIPSLRDCFVASLLAMTVISQPLAALSLIALLMLAGCAPHDSSARDDRPGGFYGGVSGGLSRP
jgi:hypothetical protein